MCVIKGTVRHSGSQVYGCILNIHGDNWQKVAEFINQLAQAHGSVVKIDLAPANDPQLLKFAIFYDRVNSSLHFRKYMEIFNQNLNISMWDLVHCETPSTNH